VNYYSVLLGQLRKKLKKWNIFGVAIRIKLKPPIARSFFLYSLRRQPKERQAQ
jgi:hypothetical protein